MLTRTRLRVIATWVLCSTALIGAAGSIGVQSGARNTDVYPPWQHGENDGALNRGFEFTVPEVDNLADFHGEPLKPSLVLYVGGNYFFAMAPLVHAFEARYPEYRGKLYWETIPPGLLLRQIKAGGTITVGNMTWTVKPDVYLAGLRAVKEQITTGLLIGPAVPYVTNALTIMVAKGNPARITGLPDLGRAGVRLAMPNPEWEGVARQIQASLLKAGGEALLRSVYTEKVQSGETELTQIHHRQTPLWIMQGRVAAGVTWQSEAMFEEQIGNPISHVNIAAGQNTTAIYAGALVRGAAHVQAGERWLQFIRSPQGLAIFERYGFKAYGGSSD